MRASKRDSTGPDGEGATKPRSLRAIPERIRSNREAEHRDPVLGMFKRPNRARFRRSSDVLIEPKEHGRLKAAAIAAELATGRREESSVDARRSVLVRLCRMTLGFTVMLAGVIMLVIPGPGWLGIAAGLAILSKDVAWADSALHFIREKIPGVPADGRIPRSTWLVIGLLTASGIALGIYIQTGA